MLKKKLSKNPKVSVVIPTKNRGDSVPLILDSLVKQRYKNFEVVVVDGGSTDNSKEVVESYKKRLDIRFIVKEGGLVKQLNEGLRQVEGEIFLRTDDDAEYTPVTLKEIVKIFVSDEKIGGVSGPTVTKDMSTRDVFSFQKKFKSGNFFWKLIGRFYYDFIMEGQIDEIGKFSRSGVLSLGSNYEQALKLKKPVEVEQGECITFGYRTEILKRVKGFNEQFGKLGWYNEADVAMKVRKLGYKIMLNPKAYAYHHCSKSGLYSARADSGDSITSFIMFYFDHIKPNTFNKMIHFLGYVLFQNLYYTYMFFIQRNWEFLGCWPASAITILKYSIKPSSWRGGMKFG